jgi:hypothetical protein
MAFYKLENDIVESAECVSGTGFDLNTVSKDEYTYPVAGWWWFDTDVDASAHFGVPVPSVPVEENTEQSP